MKRSLLPLNALRVFDAAARHLSFTRAADELAVTPAAVGQQIRTLEDYLGTKLFRRTGKGLELTDEASAGLGALREGFLEFEESVQSMQAWQVSERYTIAAPHELYAAWLSHRLAAFRDKNPRAHYHLIGDENADFAETNLDVAIRLTDGSGDLEGVKLAPARHAVVGAPALPVEWIDWPGALLPEGVEARVHVDTPGQALSSAIAGLGKTVLPLLLVQDALTEGRLVELGSLEEANSAYWLIAPLPQWRQKKVKALVAFLTT